MEFEGKLPYAKLFTLNLSWASGIQSTPSHLIYVISILILYSHLLLGLPSGILLSEFPTKIEYVPVFIVSPMRAVYPTQFILSWFSDPNNIKWRVQIKKLLFI
jgi:hypothetical protein